MARAPRAATMSRHPPSDNRFGCVPLWSLWRWVARALGQVLAHRHARPAGGGADAGDRREQGVLSEVVGLPPGDLIEQVRFGPAMESCCGQHCVLEPRVLLAAERCWSAQTVLSTTRPGPSRPGRLLLPGSSTTAAPEHVAATIHAGRAACICMRQLCDCSDSARPGERTIHTEPGHYERIDRRRRVFIGTSRIGRDLREVDGHGESAGPATVVAGPR